MSSMREYEEKKLEEERLMRIERLIMEYRAYLMSKDRIQINIIHNSNSFELQARSYK